MDVHKMKDELERLRAENQSLIRELQFKNQNISLLNHINANMRAALRCQEVYFLILTGATAEPGLGFNRGMLFIREPDSAALAGVMAISPDSEEDMHRLYEEVEKKRFSFEFYIEQFYEQNLRVKNKLNSVVSKIRFSRSEVNILNAALRQRQPRIVPKYRPEDFAGIEEFGEQFQNEYVVAPILSRREEIGVLVADHHFTGKKIVAHDLLAVQTLCDFAASLIQSAQRYEHAEKLSIVDELTQIHNFRYFQRKLGEEVERGKRYGRPFAVAMIDIDSFKNFNDRNGHLTGNKALMDLASLLDTHVRAVDFVARYGGEEFAIILPETSREGAHAAAEKLLARIRKTKFIGEENQPGGKFSVSAGIAAYPEDGATEEAVIEAADRRLYLAKAAGKDRVVSGEK